MSQDVKNDRCAWLVGPAAQCRNVKPQNRPCRLVLLGAPGVGKGTQAELLIERTGACHLSTGDVFRAAKALRDADRSPAMTAALDYMRRGELVPDSTVWELVRERSNCLHCPGGFILDGFPRTLSQATSLQNLLQREKVPLDAVLNYELPLEEIVARISGRRTCGKCKAVFHVTGRPPKKAGVCDNCGGALVQREDDRPESVEVRMAAYARSTAPLTEFYGKQGLLVPIPATGAPEEILQRTLAALGRRS